MAQKKRKEAREPIQVGVGIKRKIEKYLIGDKRTLGEFYNSAAEAKLISESFVKRNLKANNLTERQVTAYKNKLQKESTKS